VLHRQGRHLEAYHLFLEAARRMPENCDPLFHAAQALLDTKTTDGSADLLARLPGLCPDSHSRWRTAVLRSLFAEIAGRYKEAIDAMQDADRLRPGMVETMRRIANLYEASGDMSGATFALRKLLSGFPDDRAARAQLERISRWGPGKRP
jgi:tetratricopeptide (TPR) repeat protein